MNEMFINPIQPIEFGKGIENVQRVTGQQGVSMFKEIFQEALGNVRNTDADLANKQYLLATGQIEDAHSVSIAAAQAQLSVDTLVNLRNKALESYNELMRINL